MIRIDIYLSNNEVMTISEALKKINVGGLTAIKKRGRGMDWMGIGTVVSLFTFHYSVILFNFSILNSDFHIFNIILTELCGFEPQFETVVQI